jgi:Fe-S-cluster containining protein
MVDRLPSSSLPTSIRLQVPTPPGEETLTGQVELKIAGVAVAFDLDIPAGPTGLEDLLPVFQGLADAVVSQGEARVAAQGRAISCRAGCGACCRQPVPIAEHEARAIAALVEALPEPRRAMVRARFADAQRRLDESGLAARFSDLPNTDSGPILGLGLDYFRLGLACPFLEAESCSIHADRPLACREYLVTSPASACAAPSAETVRRVDLASLPSRALREVGRAATRDGWLLLIDALSFVRRHPGPTPKRPARDWVEAVFARFAAG